MRKNQESTLHNIGTDRKNNVLYEHRKSGFLLKPIIQYAVTRNLEVIGESAKRISEEHRASLPAIPWRGITGLRDVLIHQVRGGKSCRSLDDRRKRPSAFQRKYQQNSSAVWPIRKRIIR